MIEREEFLKFVADKHRLILDSNDPMVSIFVLSDVIYERLNDKILEVHAKESQRLLQGVRGIVKEGRFDFGRGVESVLQIMRSENLRHSSEISDIAKQHIEALERVASDVKKLVAWAWIGAAAVLSMTLILLIRTL